MLDLEGRTQDSQQLAKNDQPLRRMMEDQNVYISTIATGLQLCVEVLYSWTGRVVEVRRGYGSKLGVGARTIYAYSVGIRRVLRGTHLKLGLFSRLLSESGPALRSLGLFTLVGHMSWSLWADAQQDISHSLHSLKPSKKSINSGWFHAPFSSPSRTTRSLITWSITWCVTCRSVWSGYLRVWTTWIAAQASSAVNPNSIEC
jgi:hypothetical protein